MEKIEFIKKMDFENLPKTSGVYFFYSKNEPIYIGKAINIRNRVKNHFQQPSYRDNLFISLVNKIGYMETNSEIEALLTEAGLIKKYQPKFNVVWRDDKNYFFVAITKTERPYVFITHQKTANAEYIGPFVDGQALKKTLKFLRRIFPHYTTKTHPKRKCTWCHLDLCPGPDPDLKLYNKNLKKLALVLRGNGKKVLKSLENEMKTASKANNFEEAAKIRDKIFAYKKIMSHHSIIREEVRGSRDSTDLFTGRIECYDISNIQGKFATGSMVVFENGRPAKDQYRKFKIKSPAEPNDILMLKEVLQRRFSGQGWKYPKAILIDGGKGQLNAAIEVVPPQIKVMSIAKGRQELFVAGQKFPTPLKNLPQKIYNLIKSLDEEAHRFAVTYHRKLREKALLD
jgi:excinuclease ABC subunit C